MTRFDKAARIPIIFRIILMLIPILFFVLAEFSFSLFWSGRQDTKLFIQDPFAPDYFTVNQTAGKRYFSGATFGGFGTQDAFLKKKPSNGLRIFVLGGSTTAGYPYLFSGSFPAMLQTRLETLYPEKRVEVVNLGMTAVNSFTVRDFTFDCLDYEPDMFIIYSGHNEFYGALGSASTQGRIFPGNLKLTRAVIALRKLNLYRFIQDIVAKTFSRNSGQSQTLMARMAGDKTIDLSAPIFVKTTENYSANITDVVRLAGKSNLPVLIGSLASNLRDQKPFVSILPPSVDAGLFSSAIDRIKNRMFAGDFTSALTVLDSLINLAPNYALTHFYAGRCYEFTGNYEAALIQYRQARDSDGLRFRAATAMNQAIRKICDQYENAVYTAVEEKFSALSPNGLIGNNIILEHLHPNLEGYFSMAKSYAESIRSILPSGIQLSTDDEIKLKNSIGVTLLDSTLAQMRIAMLTSGWPFNDSQRFLTVDQIQSNSSVETLALSVLKKGTDYEKAHVALARKYSDEQKWDLAVREYETLAQTFRNNESPLQAAAKILINQRDFDRALPLLLRTLKLTNDGFSYKWAGTIILDKGDAKAAVPYLEKAIILLPKDQQLLYNLSGAYFLAADTTRAIKTLESLLKINPQNGEASRFLSRLIKAG